MSRSQAEQLKNRGSIPDGDKKYFSHPKLSVRFWGPTSVLFDGVCLHGVYRDKFVFTESLFFSLVAMTRYFTTANRKIYGRKW